jgi:transcriptional regulator with XRE-family HTH domain
MEVSLGTRLRTQRQRHGVTLAAIADETKINVALLEGLERDDLSRWPGGLFRRAYLRSYARAIGLDPDVTLREFMEVHPAPFDEFEAADAVAKAKANGGFLRSGLAVFRRESPPLETSARLIAPRIPARGEAGDTNTLRDISAPPATPSTDQATTNLTALARLCTALGCAEDQHAVQQVLADAGRVLDARGLVVWVWDTFRSGLMPAIAHGYPDITLPQLAALGRSADSAVAAAFRTAKMCVVPGDARGAGAVVTPLFTPEGCVGVLAIEFRNGGEQRETAHAFAAILGAQISTLLPASVMAEAATA